MNWLLIGLGAAVGACGRHALGLLLNPLLAPMPLGTLAANLVGGFAMGAVLALVGHAAAFDGGLKLFIVSGLLGGLTTFSAFSGDVATLLSRGEYLWAAVVTSCHVAGSIALTLLGYALVAMSLQRT